MTTAGFRVTALWAARPTGLVSAWFRRRGRTVRGVALAVLAVTIVAQGGARAADGPPLRAGIIGLDTSHAVAFTGLLHKDDPAPGLSGVRVVAAYPQGSRDIESSVKRVPDYTEKMRGYGVEIVDSIPALLARVDVVLLESNDGRVHLEQAVPVLAAKKPLFIDKPMTASLADAIAIFAIARHHGTPVFSASALRYGPQTQAVRAGSLGKVLGCDTHSPYSLEPTHPDLFWYGIHGCESLFTVMGPGCESVSRTSGTGTELVVGLWSGGRVGTFRGLAAGKSGYGGTAFGADRIGPVGEFGGYDPLVVEIVTFFKTRKPPVEERETLEILAFMEAADESRRRNGGRVTLAEMFAKAEPVARERAAAHAATK